MKKLFLIAALVVLSMGAYAQQGSKSLVFKGGYQTESERFGIGAQGRYGLTDNIRIAPEAIFFFPKNHVTGLDINVDVHYVFNLQDGLSLYPLAGLGMGNNRYSNNGFSVSSTDFGLNLGAGLDYSLSESSFLNAEFKYTLSDGDHAFIAVGYGIKF